MDIKDEKRAGGAWIAAAVGLLILLLPALYALSIGPTQAFYQGQEAPAWLLTFYRPLAWLVNHSEVANDWLDWYLQFWLESP